MRMVPLALLFVGVLVAPAAGQPAPDSLDSARADSAAASDTDWLLLPFASYAPSTELAGGVVAGMYLPAPPNGRPSSVQVTLQGTQRHQLVAQVQPELYLGGGTWRVQGQFLVSKYPNRFYGIGGDTPAGAKEAYTSRYGILDVRAERRIRSNVRVGPRLFGRVGTVSDSEDGGLIDRGLVPGAEGGFNGGIGLSALWDARDNLYYPTSGSYAEMVATWYSAAWGSDYTFGHVTADVRGYHAMGDGVLAAQAYGEAVVGRAPFQLLPLLGGADRMRGYRTGRFRENVYWAVQAEYRVPLFWRFKGTVFVAAGEVGPRVGPDLVRGVERAVGAGGRLRLTDGGVHGRLDLAYSPTGLELYIALGEAF